MWWQSDNYILFYLQWSATAPYRTHRKSHLNVYQVFDCDFPQDLSIWRKLCVHKRDVFFWVEHAIENSLSKILKSLFKAFTFASI